MVSSENRNKIDSLTGLRGAAVLLVIVSHGADSGLLYSYLGEGLGKLGVMLFFILSGYLMTKLYYFKAASSSNVIEYLKARFGRIFPLYFTMVMLSFYVVSILPEWRYDIITLTDLALNLFFLNGNHELWTIPVEVQFYVFFILMWMLSGFFNIRQTTIVVFLFLVVMLCGVITIFVKMKYGVPGQLNFCMHYFLLGYLIAVYNNKAEVFIEKLVSSPYQFLYSILVVFLFAFCIPALRKVLGIYIPLWFDPIIIISMFLVFIFTLGEIGVFRGMRSKVLIFLGEISFGLYIVHSVVLYFLLDNVVMGNGLVLFLLMCFMVVAISTLSFHFFEKPLLKYFKNI
jgi:peptidoglycan/LPS O-acetylase OafA/YrhL